MWRWSNFLQSLDPRERERVLINVDETSVRLVPEEGRGHVTKRAYRLFVSGKPMGRRASLAARRSNMTHVAATCDKPNMQPLLPQVVLVGENEVSEGRLAALRLTSPECAHIWRCTTAWVTCSRGSVRASLGEVRNRFSCVTSLCSFLRCTASARQCSCSACCGSCGFVGMRDSRQTHMGLAAMRHAFVCFLQTRFKRRGAAKKWDDSERRSKLGYRVGRCVAHRSRYHALKGLVAILFLGRNHKRTTIFIRSFAEETPDGSYSIRCVPRSSNSV